MSKMRLTEREFTQLTLPKKTNKKPQKELEKEIQAAIRNYLEWHGWYVIRHQQSLGSLKGMSDLTALKNGKTVYIEVKSSDGRLSDYQQEFGAKIKSHGGVYVVARDIKDVKFLCESCF